MHINQERKKVQNPSEASRVTTRASGPVPTGMPNSAMASMLGRESSGYAIPNLENRVLSRLPSVRQRAQAQIPQAENEADRISAAVNAGTPESVKAVMGQRMGADFSGVRFHTGAAAAAKADAMGARAYTSGADVYFGSGGFDPSVAAHELVHTAQQGMVDSGISVMSAPAGGVQMMPNPFSFLWRKTGGRAVRHHHDAMDEYHQAQGSGQWSKLTNTSKAKWILRNPMAYAHYELSGKADENARARADKRQKELKAAEDFIKDKQDTLGPSSMITTDASGAMKIGRGKADAVEYKAPDSTGKKIAKRTGHGISRVSDFVDNIASPIADITSGSLEAADKTGAADIVGGVGGGFGIGTGIVGAVKDVKDIKEAIQDGNYADLAGSVSSFGGNLSKIGSGAAGIGKAAIGKGGKGYTTAGKAGAGLDIVSGLATMGKGGIDTLDAGINRHRLSKFEDENFGPLTREQILGKSTGSKARLTEEKAKQHLLMRDITAQGKMENTRKMVKGAGDIVSGAADTLAGGLEMGGVTAGAGVGVKAVGALSKGGFAAYDKYQKTRMERKVSEQTTGITDEVIRQFKKDHKIDSYSRAKQALYKQMGYTTGYRAEAYADQTEKRGAMLANMANSGGTGDETKMAKQLAKGLGVKTDKKTGAYDAEKLAKAMGRQDSRSDIVRRRNRIDYMAQYQKP